MMKVIVPNELKLLSCSIAESDTVDGAAWDAAAAYARDAKVRHGHVSYTSLVDDNKGNDPSNTWSGDDAKWKKIEATMPWRMLDDFVETQAKEEAGKILSFCVPFDRADAFALLNLDGFSAHITITDLDDNEIAWEDSPNLLADIYNLSLFEYNFSPLVGIRNFVRSDLPMCLNGKLCVELEPGTDEYVAALGHVIAGRQFEIGWTEYEAELGFTDYSRKTTDEFGVTRLVRRSSSNSMSLPIYLHPDHLDYAAQILSNVRGIPCVWIGDNVDSGHQCLTLYGWLEDYRLVCQGPNQIDLSLEIQGMI